MAIRTATKEPATVRVSAVQTVNKIPVTIRLDADVVAKFKATGKGWQTRINEALKRSA